MQGGQGREWRDEGSLPRRGTGGPQPLHHNASNLVSREGGFSVADVWCSICPEPGGEIPRGRADDRGDGFERIVIPLDVAHDLALGADVRRQPIAAAQVFVWHGLQGREKEWKDDRLHGRSVAAWGGVGLMLGLMLVPGWRRPASCDAAVTSHNER